MLEIVGGEREGNGRALKTVAYEALPGVERGL
jgi:hypothetical protein